MASNIGAHLRALIIRLKSHLVQLNLFYTGIEDAQIVRNERRSTRLYLILLIISIVTLTFYYTITNFPTTIIIKSPPYEKYLTEVHQSSLQCLCSKAAIPHEEFSQIEPFYYELCENDFVSNDLINHLFFLYEQSWNNSIPTDFRRIAVFQFQTIRSLCQLAKEINQNELDAFHRKEFIHSQLIPSDLFQEQINSFITEFIESTPLMFSRTLKFVQNISAQSLLMTGASMTSILPNFQLWQMFEQEKSPYVGMIYKFSDNSTCTCSSSTATTCMGTATFQNENVDGFQTGCCMMSALFKSTLQFLYNQSFLNKLSNSSDKFQKFNSSISNRTIEMLLNQMFVDHWMNVTSYKRYFNACAPDLCQYSVNQRYGFLRMIAIMIELYGGLSWALTIVAPFVITVIWPAVYKFVKRRRTPVNHIEPVTENTTRSLKILLQSIKRTIIELNLFKTIPPSQETNVIQQQRYSTRVYVILLLTGLLILAVFTSVQIQTFSVTIKTPNSTEFSELYEQHSLSLNCPCSQPTIKYNQFIHHLKPQYHQICSSEFISYNWINLKFIKDPFIWIYIHDIRSQLQTHFQLLSTLCHVSNQIVEDNLQLFYQTRFVSQQVLTLQSFRIQTDLIIEQFITTLPVSFQNTLELIKVNMEFNQFILPINSFFNFGAPESDILQQNQFFYSERPNCDKNNNTCQCVALSVYDCYKKTRIIDNDINYVIPGMFLTWFPLQSLLMSTLECLYDDICLIQIKAFINATSSMTNFSILNSISESYSNNSYKQIEILANRLFIQSWNNQSSYESYFDQCNPLTCEYTYNSRLSLIYMITTIIGILGGLTIASRLLAPLIVKLASRIRDYVTRRRDNVVLAVESTSARSGFSGGFRLYVRFAAQKLVELNLFPSKIPSHDQKILRRERHTTRIYLISLIIAFIIILIYTSLRQETIAFTENSPSVSKYTELYKQYPLTLKCPCSGIAVKYNRFISQIEPQYHHICSSRFVLPEWIESLLLDRVWENSYSIDRDFHVPIRLQFLIISKFCTLSRKTIDSSLTIFHQTDFVTTRVISRTDFTVQVDALFDQFKRTTADQFMQIFKLIQATNHGNQLATSFKSNWRFIFKYYSGQLDPNNDLTDLPALTRPKTYGTDNCSCAMQPNCSELADFRYPASNYSLKQRPSGFRIGCLPLDAFLQSSLTCLYDNICVNLMQAAIFYSKPVPVDTLTYTSSMEINTTIETILSQLFITKWFNDSSYDRYFNECNPQSCQYSYSTKYNRVYIITTLIGLFGGLKQGLHFVVYCMAFIVFKLYDRLKRNNNVVAPHLEQENIAAIDPENNACELVSVPPAVIAQLSVNPIDQQIEPQTTKTERIYLVCLSLMIIVAIVIASTVWFIGGRNDAKNIVSSSTLMTPNATTESTTAVTHTCYMTFKYPIQTYPTGLNPKSFVINDFNRDLIQDLAVTNFGNDTFSILLGNGNGTFQTQLIFPTGELTNPWGIATADFNNDSLLDLAISLSGINEVAIFYGIKTNALFIRSPDTLKNNISINSMLGVIEVADLNDDGLIDLVICNELIPHAEFSVIPLLIFFNTGDYRQFEIDDIFQRFGSTILITIDDFDNDGKQIDITVLTASYSLMLFPSFNVSVRDASLLISYPMYGKISSMTKGRFNDDGFKDLAFVDSQSNTLQILLANGDGTFTRQIYPTAIHPTSVTRINFNNDRFDDLAVLSCNRTITVFLGTPIGLFDRNYLSFESDEQSNGQCTHSLKVVDLNQDGTDDLVFIDAETHRVGVLLGTSCHV